MTAHSEQSIPLFARSVVEACQKLSGFEATETVEAGPIHVVARIGSRRPDGLAVEYQTYVNPLLELEEHLTGDAEYTADELVGLSLHFDGQRTWLYDASTDVCVVKVSRSLFEPLPELPVLGEIEYLRDLPHDYLLRDLGSETIDGRDARVLSLKPKHLHRTHAFKMVVFLARKASVAFDVETLFPIRSTFSPAPSSHSHQLLGPNGRVTIRYSGVRLTPDASPPFAPPEGTRVFHEEWVAIDKLAARLPFPLSLDPFHEAEYTAIDGHALLAEDAEHDRAYCAATFVHRGESEDEPTEYVTLRAGNYLNRNMARRRVLTAEVGEELTIDGRVARFLDRRQLWEEHASGIDPTQAPRELSWERDGVFWFLTGVNTERSALTQLGSNLMDGSAPQA
jgi:outer membrane lipoprotein-sorting protein